jgi:hypothetical protein
VPDDIAIDVAQHQLPQVAIETTTNSPAVRKAPQMRLAREIPDHGVLECGGFTPNFSARNASTFSLARTASASFRSQNFGVCVGRWVVLQQSTSSGNPHAGRFRFHGPSRVQVDVFAANKANLFELSDRLPGSRVLDGRIGIDEVAVALPKDREAGMAYVRKYVGDAKSEGLVKAAVQRAGPRGAADK